MFIFTLCLLIGVGGAVLPDETSFNISCPKGTIMYRLGADGAYECVLDETSAPRLGIY